jgi:hypothetical protein
MASSRYSRAGVLERRFFATQQNYKNLLRGIELGLITTREIITRPKDRLDTIAGNIYGDGRYWWIIAAVNKIGWGMQVPEGSRLLVPTRLEQVMGLI